MSTDFGMWLLFLGAAHWNTERESASNVVLFASLVREFGPEFANNDAPVNDVLRAEQGQLMGSNSYGLCEL